MGDSAREQGEGEQDSWVWLGWLSAVLVWGQCHGQEGDNEVTLCEV